MGRPRGGSHLTPTLTLTLTLTLTVTLPSNQAELTALRSPSGNPTIFSSTGCPDSFFASK